MICLDGKDDWIFVTEDTGKCDWDVRPMLWSDFDEASSRKLAARSLAPRAAWGPMKKSASKDIARPAPGQSVSETEGL